MRAVPQTVIGVMLLIAACGEPASHAANSLVGAEELPPSDELSREAIQINRGYGDFSEGFLSYELRPDNTLAVTHLDRQRDKVVGAETFQLPPETAAQARHMLWRLRPATLEGQGLLHDEIRPAGCERRGPHDFGELAVVFEKAEKAGIEDVGVFELPHLKSCNTPQASEARKLLQRVLQSFPESRVAAGLPKRS